MLGGKFSGGQFIVLDGAMGFPLKNLISRAFRADG